MLSKTLGPSLQYRKWEARKQVFCCAFSLKQPQLRFLSYSVAFSLRVAFSTHSTDADKHEDNVATQLALRRSRKCQTFLSNLLHRPNVLLVPRVGSELKLPYQNKSK